MSETKICNKCNVEKEVNKDNFQFRNDTNTYRNTCRECMNINRRKYKTTLNSEDRAQYKIRNRGNDMSKIFTETEIETLKKLIEDYPVLENLKENKIVLEKSLNKKSIRSINLEDSIYNILKEQSDKTNLSISDIANTLLKKAIEYI